MMPYEKDRYLIPLLILITVDFIIFSAGFMSAYVIRFSPLMTYLVPPPQFPPVEPYFNLSFVIAILGLFVFDRFGFYKYRYGLKRHTSSLGLIAAVMVTFVFIMAALFNYRGMSFSRLTVGLALPTTCILVVVGQNTLDWVNDVMLNRGIAYIRSILIGPVERCTDVFTRLHATCGSEFHILGYLDTNNELGPSTGGLKRLGSVKDLIHTFKENRANNVILALPGQDYDRILNLIHTCNREKIRYHVVPELFDCLTDRMTVEEAYSLDLFTIALDDIPLAGPARFVKRAIDVVLSGILLMLLSPLMAVIALLIKIDTPGEIVFRQQRIGNDGRIFTMRKFRSMHADAEKSTGPVWARSEDPRCTRVGRWLRRTNLDELPQLFNVLNGDMSLVGPRPERPYFVNNFKTRIPQYMRRHMVKSGITGWAQVNGLRGDTSVEERTQYDIFYIEHWSLLLDLKILWRTLTSFKNAY